MASRNLPDRLQKRALDPLLSVVVNVTVSWWKSSAYIRVIGYLTVRKQQPNNTTLRSAVELKKLQDLVITGGGHIAQVSIPVGLPTAKEDWASKPRRAQQNAEIAFPMIKEC